VDQYALNISLVTIIALSKKPKATKCSVQNTISLIAYGSKDNIEYTEKRDSKDNIGSA
jgi:hypothetical protein